MEPPPRGAGEAASTRARADARAGAAGAAAAATDNAAPAPDVRAADDNVRSLALGAGGARAARGGAGAAVRRRASSTCASIGRPSSRASASSSRASASRPAPPRGFPTSAASPAPFRMPRRRRPPPALLDLGGMPLCVGPRCARAPCVDTAAKSALPLGVQSDLLPFVAAAATTVAVEPPCPSDQRIAPVISGNGRMLQLTCIRQRDCVRMTAEASKNGRASETGNGPSLAPATSTHHYTPHVLHTFRPGGPRNRSGALPLWHPSMPRCARHPPTIGAQQRPLCHSLRPRWSRLGTT